MSDHSHSHSHGHEHHQHDHDHQHGHTGHNHQHGDSHQHGPHKAHTHSSGDTTDQWVGKDYLNYPGLRELAKTNHETTLRALVAAGIPHEKISTLNLLEVGCGAGAVTQLFSKSFKSVHAIDVSQSMLSTFSTELPSEKYPNVTHSLHTLSSSSPEEFAKGSMKSPVEGDADRVVPLPRSKWDVAAVILVLHHVDDIEGFMTGLTGLVEDGGWVVFSEFTNLGQGHKATEEGSVNAPHHFHHEFTVESITKLLGRFGLVNVHAEVQGTMKIWREDKFHDVDCLVARGQKPSIKGSL